MWKVTAFIMLLAVMVGIVPAASQRLPCDSQLRRVRPQLFLHCSRCSYSQWSSWKITGKAVSTSCISGKAFNQIRTRYDLQGSCVQQNETKYTCQPTRAEKVKLFIKSLDLGHNGIIAKRPDIPKISPTAKVNVTLPKRALPDYCPTNVQKICSSTQTGKRDTTSMMMREHYPHGSLPILQDDIIPHSFNLDEELNNINKHHHRQRRMSPCCDDRYIVFVLDTSGSIGPAEFANMVDSLSNLVPLFCKNTKVAVITFGTHIYHEFCFNCFENDPLRAKIQQAISSIPYHGGGTHTGRALKCTCDEILSTACGLPNEKEYKECPAPIDVVVLTDGHSNGPLDVCEAAKCLHDHKLYDINTFSIGMKNYDLVELDCIVNQNDLNVNHIFDVANVTEFSLLIADIIKYLTTLDPNGQYRTCYNPNKLL